MKKVIGAAALAAVLAVVARKVRDRQVMPVRKSDESTHHTINIDPTWLDYEAAERKGRYHG